MFTVWNKHSKSYKWNMRDKNRFISRQIQIKYRKNTLTLSLFNVNFLLFITNNISIIYTLFSYFALWNSYNIVIRRYFSLIEITLNQSCINHVLNNKNLKGLTFWKIKICLFHKQNINSYLIFNDFAICIAAPRNRVHRGISLSLPLFAILPGAQVQFN